MHYALRSNKENYSYSQNTAGRAANPLGRGYLYQSKFGQKSLANALRPANGGIR